MDEQLVIAALLLGIGLGALLGHKATLVPVARAVRDLEALRGPSSLPSGKANGILGRLQTAVAAVGETVGYLQDVATIDRQLGIPTRQALLSGLFNEFEAARRDDQWITLACLEFDALRLLADSQGTMARDHLLKRLATSVNSVIPGDVVLGRWSGDVLMAVMPARNMQAGVAVCEMARSLVAQMAEDAHVTMEGRAMKVTLSAGVASGHGGDLRLDTLVRDAESGLREAKRQGRNRVVAWPTREQLESSADN